MQKIFKEFSAGEASSMTNDLDSGLISGVKILGLTSRNGRVYPPEVLREAAPLYEGAKVNVNHVSKEAARLPRDYRDRIGTVSNVVFKENSGLFADFHYNPNHAQAKQLLWDAHNAPNNVGFSHCVEAVYHQENDLSVIDKIVRVISVDLVADPATTNGLFESEEPEEGNRQEAVGSSDSPSAEEGSRQETVGSSDSPTGDECVYGGRVLPALVADNVRSPEARSPETDNRFDRLIESFEELKERLEQLCKTLENRTVTEAAPLCPPSAWQQTAVKEETLEEFVRRLKN
ncbi:MAG: hypothetical protein IJF84_05990 [Thermoguttaceae bacterium]|nr:hypothetical protein [Thermoguttaceae bacterium]